METPATSMGVDGMEERRKIVTSTSISKNEYMNGEDLSTSSSSPVRARISQDNGVANNQSSITVSGESELPVKVPIVGFETMEERAKFTV